MAATTQSAVSLAGLPCALQQATQACDAGNVLDTYAAMSGYVLQGSRHGCLSLAYIAHPALFNMPMTDIGSAHACIVQLQVIFLGLCVCRRLN